MNKIQAVIDEIIPPPPKKFFPIEFSKTDFLPESFGFERINRYMDWASGYLGIEWHGGKDWRWKVYRSPQGKFSLRDADDLWRKRDHISCDWPTIEQGAVIMSLFGFKRWEEIKSPRKYNFRRVEV